MSNTKIGPNGQLNICTLGFRVIFKGDPSVGVGDQEWYLTGRDGFEFSSSEDYQAFKEKIAEAFEYCSDTPITVESVEERIHDILNDVF